MTRSRGPGTPEVIRPGLDRILAALDLSGHPERAFRTLHVAGTNGKGSTSVFLESIVGRALRRPVGLYTSPHLVSPEERIRISGGAIPARALAGLLREGGALSRRVAGAAGGPMSYFEVMTWAACAWFRRRGVRVVVMEAGLGGRWDATTACRPAVSVITTIGIDHREWLGGTLPRIAFEKAGVIRRGVPLVTGFLRPSARKVVRSVARAAGVPVWELGTDFRWTDAGGGRTGFALPGARVPPVRIAMEGRFQRDNAAVACGAAWRFLSAEGVTADAFAAAAAEGLAGARIAGRLAPIPGPKAPAAWADGGHNPDAARALAAEIPGLRRRFGGGQVIALWSMLGDKDLKGYLRALSAVVDGVVPYRLAHERAATTGELAAAVRAAGIPFRPAEGFGEGWERAIRWAGPHGLVLVCGSFVAVGEAYRLLAGGEIR